MNMKKHGTEKSLFGLFNCRFSYAGTWELVNLFVGTKILATIFVMKTQTENNKILRSQETDRPWTMDHN